MYEYASTVPSSPLPTASQLDLTIHLAGKWKAQSIKITSLITLEAKVSHNI